MKRWICFAAFAVFAAAPCAAWAAMQRNIGACTQFGQVAGLAEADLLDGRPLSTAYADGLGLVGSTDPRIKSMVRVVVRQIYSNPEAARLTTPGQVQSAVTVHCQQGYLRRQREAKRAEGN